MNKYRLTSACTWPPTALFFKGHAPAKTLLIGMSLAGPVSGDARGWAAFVYIWDEINHIREKHWISVVNPVNRPSDISISWSMVICPGSWRNTQSSAGRRNIYRRPTHLWCETISSLLFVLWCLVPVSISLSFVTKILSSLSCAVYIFSNAYLVLLLCVY